MAPHGSAGAIPSESTQLALESSQARRCGVNLPTPCNRLTRRDGRKSGLPAVAPTFCRLSVARSSRPAGDSEATFPFPGIDHGVCWLIARFQAREPYRTDVLVYPSGEFSVQYQNFISTARTAQIMLPPLHANLLGSYIPLSNFPPTICAVCAGTV